jgi:hypothetical protein
VTDVSDSAVHTIWNDEIAHVRMDGGENVTVNADAVVSEATISAFLTALEPTKAQEPQRLDRNEHLASQSGSTLTHEPWIRSDTERKIQQPSCYSMERLHEQHVGVDL